MGTDATLRLKWEEDNDWVESAVFGSNSAHIHSVGQWWVEDINDQRLDGGYLPGLTRDQLKFVAEEQLRYRLRMAAETLDESWIEAPAPQEDCDEDDCYRERPLRVSLATCQDLLELLQEEKYPEGPDPVLSEPSLYQFAYGGVFKNGKLMSGSAAGDFRSLDPELSEPAPSGSAAVDAVLSENYRKNMEYFQLRLESEEIISDMLEPSGYDQIQAAIRAEARTVKL